MMLTTLTQNGQTIQIDKEGFITDLGLGVKLYNTCSEFARTSNNSLALAHRMHVRLLDFNLIEDGVDILYDLEQRYRIYFKFAEREFCFETWADWQGGLNWFLKQKEVV